MKKRKLGNSNLEVSAVLLGRFVLDSWEGALLRMRAEKTDTPLREFKKVIFGALLI